MSDSENIYDKECIICYENIECKLLFSDGSCDHYCCKNCLTAYINEKIDEQYVEISCPGRIKSDYDYGYNNCDNKLSYRKICKYITYDQISKLDKNIVREALPPAAPILNCPNCENIIKLENDEQKEISCSECDNNFCTTCFEKIDNYYYYHNCNLLNELGDDEIKRCPKCLSGISKIEGCDCMKCPICRRRFCWNCRKIFKKGDSIEAHKRECREFEAFNDNDSSGPDEDIDYETNF